MPVHLGGFDRPALVVPELIGIGMSFSGCSRATQDVQGEVAGNLGEDMPGGGRLSSCRLVCVR